MDLIQRLIGRRQFLIAAGLASGCALTSKKLAGLRSGVAMASQETATFGPKSSGNRCPHLLSPLRIRNVVLKNRIMHTVSPTYLMQGPENFPADAYRNHYSNMARNAAIVSINTHFGAYPKTYSPNAHGPSANFCDDIWEDIPPTHNYVQRLIEDIHCEGSLVYFSGPTGPLANTYSGGLATHATGAKELGTDAQTSGDIKEIVEEAKALEDQGYDVYKIDTNNASLKMVEAVRSATNLIIMAHISAGGMGGGTGGPPPGGGDISQLPVSGTGQDMPGGSAPSVRMGAGGASIPGITNNNQPTDAEVEKVVETAKRLEGMADFLWIRDSRSGAWVQDKGRPASLSYAEAIKKAGIKVLTCPGTGFHNPLENEEFIASGRTDMVAMTRPFFADAELVEKVSQGRADDVIPCVGCQNCHGISMTNGPWYSTCTVNPKWGLPAYKLAGIRAPRQTKKVAVIGGGPGGMKAAMVAAERGHKVTLFEKDDALGGLQRFTDYTQWKWDYKAFKDYLVHQVNKQGVEVRLNTRATPEMIKAKGYDTILVATGATPAVSSIPGADGKNVFDIMSSYTKKKALGKNVVVIGAGVFGTEAAICMAKDGHKVTIITGEKQLIPAEAIGPHNMENQQRLSQSHPNITSILEATATRIANGKVFYRDFSGSEKSVRAESVVIYSGLKPNMDEAMRFEGSADQVLLLGDCTGKNGTIQKTIRSAFFMASQV
ncbi:MAG: FAD-dependent oxidoreductase [Deltaproteobacteria bacterium]|nr:FAD-dependent oxidoreductase [Deltaproteobacteria bacterium]